MRLLCILPLFPGCATVAPAIQDQIARELEERAETAIQAEMRGDSAGLGDGGSPAGGETAGDGGTAGAPATATGPGADLAERVLCASQGTDCADGEAFTDEPAPTVDPTYDFVAGDRVLVELEVPAGEPGGTPRGIEVRRGNWDVIERDGRGWLRSTGPRGAALAIGLPETLSGSFTIEFELALSHPSQRLVVATTVPDGPGLFALPGNAFQVGASHGRTGIIAAVGSDGAQSLGTTPEVADAPMRVRIMVDGPRASLYVGDRAVARVEGGSFERGTVIYLQNAYFATEADPLLIGPIRVAVSDRPDAGGAK